MVEFILQNLTKLPFLFRNGISETDADDSSLEISAVTSGRISEVHKLGCIHEVKLFTCTFRGW